MYYVLKSNIIVVVKKLKCVQICVGVCICPISNICITDGCLKTLQKLTSAFVD